MDTSQEITLLIHGAVAVVVAAILIGIAVEWLVLWLKRRAAKAVDHVERYWSEGL